MSKKWTTQDELLQEYMLIVTEYYNTLQSLYRKLRDHIVVTGLPDDSLTPIAPPRTIAQQIQQLPKTFYYLPPTAWVHPRTGVIEFNSLLWDYAFHGGGVSFFRKDIECDISGEFARTGELAITQHTIWCYLNTNPLKHKYWNGIMQRLELYFEEIKQRNIALPVPSFFEQDDETYILDTT